ncbi:MAG TPA: DUF4080 domain-containing protein [Candidatus Paceibacterota bacterium]|nr:DUF4080 domain-containing protein [Verrucomicrobiota bacterium]HSA10865.1 DUF4080 domain-containing protein [Candidatus Paceibacterota bacterium]
MPDIVLTTLNAKHIHTAFGLRYLLANLGPLRSAAALAEFDLGQRPVEIAEALLARQPKIIGLGIYIWNVAPATEVVAILKRVRPDITLVLGGPEVSFETESRPIVALADYTITGEGDLAFADLCRQLLSGGRPGSRIIPASPPELAELVLPYDLYDDHDVAHRVIYVEASRGCPFSCEFCLSSLDIPVRQTPLPALLDHLQHLLDRGVRQFKFVDRTFNLNLNAARAILQFLFEHHCPGHLFHFEIIPDRLPDALREIIARFPPGALQFEIGVQTFNEEVAARIQRRQDYARLEDNFRFLREHTGVHLHADLIAGLPGESLESFAAGFDRLVALRPHEIQVGILKRLSGAPIARHDTEWQMLYSPHPPYDILQNRLIEFPAMQNLRRFARYWDLVANSGNFRETTPLLWTHPPDAYAAPSPPNNHPSSTSGQPFSLSPSEGKRAGVRGSGVQTAIGGAGVHSPFAAFLRFTEWLYARTRRTDGIALLRLAELLFEYLTAVRRLDPAQTAAVLCRDYQRPGRRDTPRFLRSLLPASAQPPIPAPARPAAPKRQARHWA